ncbi:MAG: FecR domain-containing protein, partial [Bacteroidota bacterium]
MKTNKQLALLLRSFDDDLSEKEQKLLRMLLASSDEAVDTQQDLTALRDAIRAAKPEGQFNPGFADRVVAATQAEKTKPARMARIYTLNSSTILRVAAVFLLLVGISTALWFQPKTYTAPLGQSISKMLPDGSSVLLSGGSTLAYKPFWGRNARHVTLTGEAFFDVAKGDKAFVVETFNSEVRVLGTRFNVRAWPEQADVYTAVILEEGSVTVANKTAPATLHYLEPDESIVLTADTTLPKRTLQMPIATKLAWRTGGHTFENEYLTDVAAALGRRYNARLTLDGDVGMKRITYIEPQQQALTDVLAA